MEYFSLEGVWWLPEHETRRISGTLSYSESGIELLLYGLLDGFPGPTIGPAVEVESPEWTTFPRVYGRSRDSKDVTIFAVRGESFDHPIEYEVKMTYLVGVALVGFHAPDEAFTNAMVRFDQLSSWAEPSSILLREPTQGRETIRTEIVDLAEAEFDGDSVRLQTGVVGSWGNRAVNVDRSTWFEIDFKSTTTVEEAVENRVRPLQDLLTFSLGRTVRLTSLKLLPKDAELHTGYCDAYFNAILAPRSTGAKSETMAWGYAQPTLLSVRNTPIAINDLLCKWFEMWKELREVLALLLAHHYAPFMYGENKFATIFQSAEALHRKRFESREIDKDSHKARVRAIVEAANEADVDGEIVAWAARVLQVRNDKPLWKKIDELVLSVGAVGEAVLKAAPRFSATIIDSRTGVSHGGSRFGDEDSVNRYWHGEVLDWIMRARLLSELGVPVVETAQRVLQRPAFRHAIDQIRVGGEGAGPSAHPA